MRRSLPAAVLAVLTAASLAACGSDESPPGASTASATAPGGDFGDVTVFAAASLTESFTQIGEQFEEVNQGVKVTFNFGGSSALARQINEGSPADVFASASPTNMDQVTEAGNASDPTDFASNTLMIAVPRGNPGGVDGLADLADESKKIALCAEEVPCGAAAKKAFEAAGLTPRPDTLEQDVKAVLTKVSLGEVDAGLVYETDVMVAGDKVEGLAFPQAQEAVNTYPIAVLTDAPNVAGARAFVAYVLSKDGKAVLLKAGFDAP